MLNLKRIFGQNITSLSTTKVSNMGGFLALIATEKRR
jgi:hypothetical protein